MTKIALLIGISEYEPDFNQLPAVLNDITAMQRVLENPEIGGFNEVIPLLNSQLQEIKEAIENLFSNREKNDLVLLFFSGHGIKDDTDKLYFTARNTRKTNVKSTAVSASFIHEIMANSRSKHQVIIIDCCFSGAFANNMLVKKDNGFVDVKNQLGGEGRAVLTSSTSTQYSFAELKGSDTSTYYLVEGLETGAADQDEDGWISVDELHDYVKSRIQDVEPAMKPEIYPIKEGHKILLAQAPTNDLKLKYRREVDYWVNAGNGDISDAGRNVLEELQHELELTLDEINAIENDVFRPYREYQRKLKRYEDTFRKIIQDGYPISEQNRNDLKHLQRILKFTDENIALIDSNCLRCN